MLAGRLRIAATYVADADGVIVVSGDVRPHHFQRAPDLDGAVRQDHEVVAHSVPAVLAMLPVDVLDCDLRGGKVVGAMDDNAVDAAGCGAICLQQRDDVLSVFRSLIFAIVLYDVRTCYVELHGPAHGVLQSRGVERLDGGRERHPPERRG